MNELAKQGEPNHSYGRDQVVKIINSVISKVEGTDTVSKEAIFKELQDLQNIIEAARKEIGQARPADIKDKHIPTATDELDAVVEATADATGTIMDACEAIQEKAGGDSADAVNAEVMKIYEACSFQDITGQRITKVITTIKTIEEKVDRLVSVLSEQMPGGVGGTDAADAGGGGDDEDQRSGDEALLNGPQMADQAISQDEIDKLLAEFD